MKKQTYKLIKKDDNILDCIIEKRNLTSEFTIRQIEANLAAMAKLKKELIAKLELEKSKVENIEHFHAFVKDMSEQDRNTVYMYQEALEFVKQIEPKLQEVEEVVKADETTILEAKEALNLHEESNEPALEG